jgi:uncharacterized protein (DUF486 family)
MSLHPIVPTVLLLLVSNVFMALAWYRHLRAQADAPLWMAIAVSWAIALPEYCLAVPANRIGISSFTIVELRALQEIISLVVFGLVAITLLGQRLAWNHLAAGALLVGAALLVFRAPGAHPL